MGKQLTEIDKKILIYGFENITISYEDIINNISNKFDNESIGKILEELFIFGVYRKENKFYFNSLDIELLNKFNFNLNHKLYVNNNKIFDDEYSSFIIFKDEEKKIDLYEKYNLGYYFIGCCFYGILGFKYHVNLKNNILLTLISIIIFLTIFLSISRYLNKRRYKIDFKYKKLISINFIELLMYMKNIEITDIIENKKIETTKKDLVEILSYGTINKLGSYNSIKHINNFTEYIIKYLKQTNLLNKNDIEKFKQHIFHLYFVNKNEKFKHLYKFEFENLINKKIINFESIKSRFDFSNIRSESTYYIISLSITTLISLIISYEWNMFEFIATSGVLFGVIRSIFNNNNK